METNGYPNFPENNVPVVSLVCSNCTNIHLSISDLKEKKEGNHKISTYTLKCDDCGATCKVIEDWDLGEVDESKQSDAVVIGII